MFEAYRNLAFILYGSFNFTKSAYLKHAANFRNEDTAVDLSGKSCIVTGANSGLGYATAEALASKGAIVYAVCRNKERGEQAVSDIISKTGNENVKLEICDLSSMKDVKDFASRFLGNERPLYALINNAGLLENERKVTDEGLELNFAVNVAGTYLLTELLIPALEKAPDSRVVVVSSGGMYHSPLTEDLQFSQGKFNGVLQYSRNKRLQVAMTERWADLYGQKGIGFYSMHPGWADTPGVATSIPAFKTKFEAKLRTPQEGADTSIWLAMQPNSKLKSGAFYFDRREAPKHLLGCGTAYRSEQVDKILSKVREICGLNST